MLIYICQNVSSPRSYVNNRCREFLRTYGLEKAEFERKYDALWNQVVLLPWMFVLVCLLPLEPTYPKNIKELWVFYLNPSEDYTDYFGIATYLLLVIPPIALLLLREMRK